MTPSSELAPVWSVSAAAREVGIDRTTLSRMIRAGKVRARPLKAARPAHVLERSEVQRLKKSRSPA